MLALMLQNDEPDDAELLFRIANIRAGSEAARAAQSIFYRRHVRYLYAVVVKRCGRVLHLSSLSAEDLVQDSFHRAFSRASTFRRDGITDPERVRTRARAWLGRIAQRLLADSLADSHEISDSPYLERLSSNDHNDDEELTTGSPKLELVCRALDSLSEREQDVLRVSALYQRVGETHQRLPNAVATELAARWNTTSDNIRAIRSRAMKRLRAAVDAGATSAISTLASEES
jgi:RNA polymerase sigma factor (sigma-70 family)